MLRKVKRNSKVTILMSVEIWNFKICHADRCCSPFGTILFVYFAELDFDVLFLNLVFINIEGCPWLKFTLNRHLEIHARTDRKLSWYKIIAVAPVLDPKAQSLHLLATEALRDNSFEFHQLEVKDARLFFILDKSLNALNHFMGNHVSFKVWSLILIRTYQFRS